jgi:putative ABC transport system ATP-binding protein
LEIIDIFQQLNDDGMTLVMVTHEPAIARFCTRKLVMRDGLVLNDIPITERLRATDELATLRHEDQASITSETAYPT